MNKEIVEKFEKIEEELQLFDMEYEGIPIWELARFWIFYKIMNSINKKKYIYSEKSLFKKKIFKILYNTIKSFYQLCIITQSDVLVLNHPRRFNIKGIGYDIYTDPILQKLPYSYVVFEDMFALDHSRNIITDKLYYLDYYIIPARIYSILFTVKLNAEIVKKILKFEERVAEELNVCIKILPFIVKEITRFVKLKNGFRKILLKVRPKLILEVVNYNGPNKVFNNLANEFNIPIVELQHGTMGKYHLGYSFPNFVKNKLKTFPNYLFVWGDFWKEQTRFPIDKDKIFVTGFPYLEQKTKQITFDDNRKDILVISQPTIAEALCKEVIKLSDVLEDEKITIYYKLHPGEIASSHILYQELYSRENIKVIDQPSITIYDLFPKCKVQIGVYSTALIEGIAFGLYTVILKLPGWEYFEDLQDNENFSFINSMDEINLKIISNKNSQLDKKNNLWINKSEEEIVTNLIKIVSSWNYL